MWRRVVCWVATDVSEEHHLHLEGRRNNFSKNQQVSRWHLNRLYGVTSRKMIRFITTAVKTSDPTFTKMFIIISQNSSRLSQIAWSTFNTRDVSWVSRRLTHILRIFSCPLYQHFNSLYYAEWWDLKNQQTPPFNIRIQKRDKATPQCRQKYQFHFRTLVLY
jgi:hypothetical protein